MKALLGAFNQEKALVEAFSILRNCKPLCNLREPSFEVLLLYIISISDQTAGAGRLGAGRGGDGGVHLLFFGQVPALPQLHHGRHHFTEMFRTEIAVNMKTFTTRNVA